MPSRLATDEEVETWRTEGWVVLGGLVGADEVDAVQEDLHRTVPSVEEYHADPEGVKEHWGAHVSEEDAFWPEGGPGFSADQQLLSAQFPFPGSGALNRLCVHPSVVDFAERTLGSRNIRLYQIHVTAKYEGITNYEQPMHTDRNHSWLPAVGAPPWWNLELFLYLSDVTDADNPTRVVSVRDTANVSPRTPVLMPDLAPELYRAERAATGVRGSLLAYRSDVFHRGAAFATPGSSRTVLALAFRRAEHEWIGYDQAQSRSTGTEWTRFAERCSPRELELFGFPPPGHPIWSADLLDATAIRYPLMDLRPWREALHGASAP
jgi:hypothetical protein